MSAPLVVAWRMFAPRAAGTAAEICRRRPIGPAFFRVFCQPVTAQILLLAARRAMLMRWRYRAEPGAVSWRSEVEAQVRWS